MPNRFIVKKLRIPKGEGLRSGRILVNLHGPINDEHGHDGGDAVLKEIALRILGITRSSDILARVTGDEFLMILPDTDTRGAETAAAKIVEVAGAPIDLESGTADISISIGVARYPDHGATAEEIVRASDRAMRQAKDRGTGNTHFLDPADSPSS